MPSLSWAWHVVAVVFLFLAHNLVCGSSPFFFLGMALRADAKERLFF